MSHFTEPLAPVVLKDGRLRDLNYPPFDFTLEDVESHMITPSPDNAPPPRISAADERLLDIAADALGWNVTPEPADPRKAAACWCGQPATDHVAMSAVDHRGIPSGSLVTIPACVRHRAVIAHAQALAYGEHHRAIEARYEARTPRVEGVVVDFHPVNLD